MSAEPPSSSNTPGRQRPALSDLSKETTEDDLWNLDEESPEIMARQPIPPPAKRPTGKSDSPLPEGQQPAESPEKPAKAKFPSRRGPLEQREPAHGAPDEIGELDELADTAKREPEPRSPTKAKHPTAPPHEPAAPPAPATEAPAKEKSTAKEVPAPAPPTEAEPARVREPKPKPVPTEALPRPRLNRREVAGLSAFVVVLVAVAIWLISHFFNQLSFKSEFVEKPDFPLKGDHVVVTAAETFWREPVREGENRDVARREVVIIPVLEISLDPDKSPSGALRIIFRNSEGQPVGDSITRSFSGGRFDASGDPVLSFPATDGFEEMGTFNAYRTGKGDPWTAEIYEGPSSNAPASNFKLLAPVPVFPLRR